jgi:hypothetical protein|tara:strand:+ start:650 stop:1006 length:357 start_codon:yes stop_codon:yes gene_type:complete
MIPLLGLLKNPLTRIIAEKTFGAITHKLEKDKIIKAREIEAAKTVSIEQIRQQQHSWKDEWIVLVFTIIFIMHFIPFFQPTMQRGWEILEFASDYWWFIILTIVGASFGVSTIKKFKK